MSSHNDSFAASGSSPTNGSGTPDFRCENHGSIFLLRPVLLLLSIGLSLTSPQIESHLEAQ